MLLKIIHLILICPIMLTGCREEKNETVSFPSRIGDITAVIEKIESSKIDNGYKTLVYGRLIFSKNNNFPVVVNLKCISLLMNGFLSKDIYVNSFVDVLAQGVNINNENNEASVFWVINGQLPKNDIQPEVFIKKACQFIVKTPSDLVSNEKVSTT